MIPKFVLVRPTRVGGVSNVSHQLRLLRADRIVERRRSGKHIFYSLADRHMVDLVRSALEHAAEET